MNINLLIFALISLIILFPIIYFLPLKISSRGKIIVIIVSFFISLTGLFTKVFFQLWQSILLLVVLILLMTMILRKRYTPLIYSMADKSSNIMDDSEPLREDRTSDLFNFNYIPVMNPHDSYEPEQPGSLILGLEELPVIQNDIDVNEAVVVQSERIGQLEEIDPTAISNEDISLQPVEESAVELTEKAAGNKIVDSELLELDEISVLLEQEAESVMVPSEAENGDKEEWTYLAELEEMMMDSQIVNIDTIVDPVSDDNPETSSNELDEILKEVEYEEDYLEPLNAAAAASEEWDSIDDESNEENEHMIETIEDDRTNTFIESTDTIVEYNDTAEVETNVQIQPIIKDHQAADQTEAQREVFQTILLQAEIAKKVLDPNQYERFLLNHINYDRPEVECFTFASMLIEHYIYKGDHDPLLVLLGQLEENFSRFPILLQEIQYLQAQYAEK